MKKYRLKTTVDAVQWTGQQENRNDPQWLIDEIVASRIYFSGGGEHMLANISSPHGRMIASPGDFILKSEDGIYVMPASEFTEKYEEVLHGPAE